ncbi:MAG: signal recognition particle-docking protein FtsY [Alphaproteobacteria bacterium]|nr:MAG: signal recognition particle-docking protein FtsY [Alphaproteobacteria bacterium]
MKPPAGGRKPAASAKPPAKDQPAGTKRAGRSKAEAAARKRSAPPRRKATPAPEAGRAADAAAPEPKPAQEPAAEPAEAGTKSLLGRVLPFGRGSQASVDEAEKTDDGAERRQEALPGEGAPAEQKGWFARLRDGLSRTSNALTENITTIFTKRKLDDATLQELEDALIQADLGVEMAVQITEEVARGRYNKEIAPEEVRAVLGAEVASVLEPMARPLEIDPARKPHVILVVGVNGTGKTTTIGKLAHQFAREGRSVMMAAGDTFRAAAIDQLKIWGERTGAPVIARDVGADAAGLTYDALQQAREQQTDVLLIDTAGRLQNKADLMEELAKIVRVIKKLDETAPHSVLLVLDATTGQNAIRQVEVFREIAGVTGLIMTKLDGTARGGILVAIARKFGLPIHAIGVGESVEDLQPFDAYEFAALIAGAHERIEVEEGVEA